MSEGRLTKRWTRGVGLTLVALVLVTFLTQCKTFSGVDPMAEDGWEKVHSLHLGDHNLVFERYRDAEREGSIATVSVRVESPLSEPLYSLRKERMQIRSAVTRVQFDCTKHAVRTLRYTMYQYNNLKGTSITHEVDGTPRWWYADAGPFDLGGFDAPREREKSAWVTVATAVCTRTAPQSAGDK
jgi:hypothetical protein